MFIFFFLLALFLYIYAPLEYNQVYCIWMAVIYLIESFFFLRKEVQNRNYITFNSLFLISFFFVTYAFAAFISGSTGEAILSSLIKRIDFKYLTKAVALSHLAINCYFLGFSLSKKRKKTMLIEPELPDLREKIDSTIINEKLSKTLYLFSFIAVFINYLSHLYTGESVAVSENPFLYDIYRCVFIIAIVCSTLINVNIKASVFEYCRKNFLYISTSFIFILLCLVIGDRGPVITCILVIAGTYLIMVKRLKGSILLLSISVAIILMFSIRMTRTSSESIQNGVGAFTESATAALAERSSIWDTMADLTGIFAEMTVGYERVQQTGIIYPAKIIIVPFYPFPMVPSLLSKLLYNKSPNELSSGALIGQYATIPWPNGTHCVIDIYIFWGLPGVIFLFFLFGCFIKWIYTKLNNDIYCLLIYIMLIGISIYIPRSSILDFIRPMGYIIFFSALIIRPKQRRHISYVEEI